MARVQTRLPIDGQKKFVGVIKQFSENVLVLQVANKDIHIEFANIDKARLKPEF